MLEATIYAVVYDNERGYSVSKSYAIADFREHEVIEALWGGPAIYSETNGACGTFEYYGSDLLDALEDQEEAAAELQEALDRFDSAIGGAEFYRVCVSC